VRVLILGLSSLVQRRVRPALHSVPGIDQIDVATKRSAGTDTARAWTEGTIYRDYAAALQRSPAELVYVSLVNSDHLRWTETALRQGRHVVVDKPAFPGLAATQGMVELAHQQGVCLAEATVYAHHPQIAWIKQQFQAAGDAPKRITTTFSIPPMNSDNFRYRRELGGGALWDLGPYAVSLGRVFWGEEPVDVAGRVLTRQETDGVDTSFAMLAEYPRGRSVVGTFGFDTIYRNRLDLIGKDLGIEADRVFTTPPEMANELRVTRPEGTATLTAPAGDAFTAFFDCVRTSIGAGDWSRLTSDVLCDAATLDRLRRATGLSAEME
jgi:predicted dehydrogenase